MNYEDFTPGRQFFGMTTPITEEEIIRFASQWDPQPFHIDKIAADGGEWQGIIASGWHTACIAMRCFCGMVLDRAPVSVSPGLDRLSWLKPVRPGDQLRLTATILERRVSESRPDRGILRWQWQLHNQHAEEVLMAQGAVFLRLEQSPSSTQSSSVDPAPSEQALPQGKAP